MSLTSLSFPTHKIITSEVFANLDNDLHTMPLYFFCQFCDFFLVQLKTETL